MNAPPPSTSIDPHKADDYGDKAGISDEVETPIEGQRGEESLLQPAPQDTPLTRQKSLDSTIDDPTSLQIPKHDGDIRAPSPDTLSLLSTTSFDALRPPPASHRRHASQSPSAAQRKTWRSAIRASYVRNKGLLLVLLAQVFGTLMNVTTRLLETEGNNGRGMHPFHILFARMGITLVLASLYMWWQRTEHFPLGARGIRLLLIARGIGGFFGVYGMYYSLLYLPLADATVITFLAPGLACWLCSYIIKEPFTRMEQMATFVSLLGVVLIARPTSFFSLGGSPPPASGTDDALLAGGAPANETGAAVDAPLAADLDHVTPEQRLAGVAVAMIGVCGAVCAYTTIRWIGKRAHPLITVNYFACWCTVVSFSVMLFWPGVGFLFPANMKEWSYLIFLGVCGFVMQFLLAAGLQYEKSSRATNMIYTQMLFALTFDKLVFGTTPGWLSIAGSSLILGSALFVAVYKGRARDKEEQARPASDEEQGFLTGEPVERGRSFRMEGAAEGAPVEEVQLRTMRH